MVIRGKLIKIAPIAQRDGQGKPSVTPPVMELYVKDMDEHLGDDLDLTLAVFPTQQQLARCLHEGEVYDFIVAGRHFRWEHGLNALIFVGVKMPVAQASLMQHLEKL